MGVVKVILAIGVGLLILRVGLVFLRAFARPTPEPPPTGELRRVRLTYRCPMCGTEVRMTRATDEDPTPPRHCLEEMEPVDNLDE